MILCNLFYIFLSILKTLIQYNIAFGKYLNFYYKYSFPNVVLHILLKHFNSKNLYTF